MRAVNLMPEGDSRRGVSSPVALLNPAYGLVAVLAVALAFVVVYVMASNSVSSRQAQLASLQQQVQAAQAQANQLTNYVSYQKLAQQRLSTVQQIAGTRFDWHSALANLSHVMPSDAAFQSLLATVAPGVSVSGAGGSVGGGAGTSGLRSDIQAPAFEIKGCSSSHDDVARLMSRLRAMPGVQRVTLADSVKGQPTASGTAVSGSSSQPPTACGHTPATFDLVIFFTPLPGAATAAGTTGVAGAPPSGATTPATTTTATATAQPVSSGSTR